MRRRLRAKRKRRDDNMADLRGNGPLGWDDFWKRNGGSATDLSAKVDAGVNCGTAARFLIESG